MAKLWQKENFVVQNVDIPGRSRTVHQGRYFVLNAKVLSIIGQKKIEAMHVEAVGEKVGAALVDLQ